METYARCLVLPSTYRDSVWLMHLSHTLESLPGVQKVAVMMGTSHNKAVLQEAELLTTEGKAGGANDLLVCVQTETPTAAAEALREATKRVTQQQQRQGNVAGEAAPRTLETALRRLPDANLACISVPGEYAVQEARKALRHGLHVFLFSARVDLEAEVALKHLAAQQGLLMMGPDCGTAILNGVPLGFANHLPRGVVGLIAASGTGLQQVSCLLAQQGVGGRDVHERIGGHNMRAALQALAQDRDTHVLVLIAKPPATHVAARLVQDAERIGKPCVLAFLGETAPRQASGAVYPVATLAQAALVAGALARGESIPIGESDIPTPLTAELQAACVALQPGQRLVRALYCGGTLAHEALGLLRRTLGTVTSNLDHTLEASHGATHVVLDLGAEEFTQARPHPMIDPSMRRQHLLEAARNPAVAVVLCDVMLGWSAHPDAAGVLAAAWEEAQTIAQAAGRGFVGIAHVCGAPQDPQGFESQCKILHNQGIILADSNAQAVGLAAAALGVQVQASAVQPLAAGQDGRTIPPHDQLSSVTMPARLPALFAAGPRIINVGLELFATQLAAHGVPVVHVDWRPPAGGNTRLASLLERLR